MSGGKKTKYELKQEKRLAAAEEEKKSWKKFKIGAGIVAALIVAAMLFSIGKSAYDNYAAVNKPYITVGEHEISEVEFNYYYINAVNSYVNTHGDMVSLFGLDTSIPLDQQTHSEGKTWKDVFVQEAASEITKVKALVDDAEANGFTYNDTTDIENIESEMAILAEAEELTTAAYYERVYGKHATVERIRSFMEENALASAYEAHLLQQNQPTEEEIETGYAENKMGFDLVDYRYFYVKTDLAEDASDDETAEAMKEAEKTAKEFVSRREKGEEFKALCEEYVAEELKENYSGESDASLMEDTAFYRVPEVALAWMYDESRAAGDITLLEDAEKNQYCVVEYLDRSNDWEATRLSISNSLAQQRVNEYTDGLLERYEVKEGRGKLLYLTLEEAETEEE